MFRSLARLSPPPVVAVPLAAFLAGAVLAAAVWLVQTTGWLW